MLTELYMFNSLMFCFLCVSVLGVLCNGILASLRTFRDRARLHLLNRRDSIDSFNRFIRMNQ
jgi:hypothetical protein